MAFLSYGVLRAQMFDIDLKIRLALVHSSALSVVAGAFFIGSEVLESFIPVQGTMLGSWLPGSSWRHCDPCSASRRGSWA